MNLPNERVHHIPRKTGPALGQAGKKFWTGKRSYCKGKKSKLVAEHTTRKLMSHVQDTQGKVSQGIFFFCPAKLAFGYNDY